MKIHVILMVMLILMMLTGPGAAADSPESLNSAGALYSKSVDLANEGRYQEALDAADRALAMNVTSLTALIQSNRAGILVMLHRNNEAIAAADAALAVEGNLTTAHSIAWYNKGNALRALGRIAEAQDAYTKAYALDNTLVPPDMSADVPGVPVSTTQKSPLSTSLVFAALCVSAFVVAVFGKK
jgi:tetratricopeptide (TPR) repeat protein